MKMKKYLLHMGGIVLLAMSVAAVYTGARGLYGLPDGDDYIDMGVRAFVPCRAYPAQVEDGVPYSSGRRMRQRTAVYLISYKATDGSGYEWEKHSGPSKAIAEKTVEEGKTVKRRVMKSRNSGNYITMSPEKNGGVFMGSLRRTYTLITVLGASYIVVYASYQRMARRKFKKSK